MFTRNALWRNQHQTSDDSSCHPSCLNNVFSVQGSKVLGFSHIKQRLPSHHSQQSFERPPGIVPQSSYSTNFTNRKPSSSMEDRSRIQRRRVQTPPNGPPRLSGRPGLLVRRARGRSCCAASHTLPAAVDEDLASMAVRGCGLALVNCSQGPK